ncbi:hypothetical protein SAMN05216311_107104 [Chitinophaga sp. CF418]|nr:hypothetical protein SAMN05216311_107104 [Chitinophaga sp. CF418]
MGKRYEGATIRKGDKNTALNFLTISYEKPVPKIIETIDPAFSFW